MDADILATLQRKIGRDNCEGAVREYQYAVYYVNEHWKDSLGKKLYAKFQLSQIELQSLEKRRSKLLLDCEDIKKRLRILVDEEESAQKRKVKKLTPASDGNYTSGSGGFSRRK